ncbi:unnamed protein product [Auanema sp. JU1783]|nr:unnamed protein product [Auanema sp. JU1783]
MTHIVKLIVFFLLHASLRTLALAFPKSEEFGSALTENESYNMTTINGFLESFFARKATLSAEEWKSRLPNMKEKDEMTKLITSIWKFETFDGVSPNLLDSYPNLKPIISITRYNNTLIVHEKPGLSRDLRRYWGYIAINDKRSAKRNLHHAAPHFESDGDVCREAAYLFESTTSRSLVVAGASRFAVRGNVYSTCLKTYHPSDSAHNSDNMFHHWNMILADLAKNTNAIFVQWHGMAETSCQNDVFISAGSRDSQVYSRDIPAVKIRDAFNQLEKQMKSTTPDIDKCRLTASTNVFGRYLNGVPPANVCERSAKAENIQGTFVHIEQKRQARDALKLWNDVIRLAYPTEV